MFGVKSLCVATMMAALVYASVIKSKGFCYAFLGLWLDIVPDNGVVNGHSG
jgi:hypothetical protein